MFTGSNDNLFIPKEIALDRVIQIQTKLEALSNWKVQALFSSILRNKYSINRREWRSAQLSQHYDSIESSIIIIRSWELQCFFCFSLVNFHDFSWGSQLVASFAPRFAVHICATWNSLLVGLIVLRLFFIFLFFPVHSNTPFYHPLTPCPTPHSPNHNSTSMHRFFLLLNNHSSSSCIMTLVKQQLKI